MMPIHVDPDWWKSLFDEVYLVTDARTVDNTDITRREVDLFCRLLAIAPDDRILDLCGGQGRHSLELCRRGYHQCTVLDYSDSLLKIGEDAAGRRQCPVLFLQGDARETGLAPDSFDHVLLLGNSLGYAVEVDADLRILKESLRLLRPGGRLLLDVTDGEAARNGLTPNVWHEIADDVVVCRQRELHDDRICAREMVLSKERGLIRDASYCIRLYALEELQVLVDQAGFGTLAVHRMDDNGDPDADLGFMDHRLVIVAEKP